MGRGGALQKGGKKRVISMPGWWRLWRPRDRNVTPNPWVSS